MKKFKLKVDIGNIVVWRSYLLVFLKNGQLLIFDKIEDLEKELA